MARRWVSSFKLWALALIFVSSLAIAAVTPLNSGPTCESLFSNEISTKAIGDSDEPKYVPSGVIIGNKETRSLDQAQAEECYLFAFLASLEMSNADQLKRAGAPPFSGAYLVAQKFIEYSKNAIWSSANNSIASIDGGHFFEALYLSRTYGLVSDQSWAPRVPYPEWNFPDLYRNLKSEIDVQNKMVAAAGTQKGWHHPDTSQKFWDGVAKVKNIVTSRTGPLPTASVVNQQSIAAKDLEVKYGIDHRARIIMHYPPGQNQGDPAFLKAGLDRAVIPFGGSWEISQLDWVPLEQKIMMWLQAGAPVVVSISWGRSGRHSMVITDYEVQSGRLKAWKFKNSWGPDWGTNGYTYYTFQDLRNHLINAWFVGYLKQ